MTMNEKKRNDFQSLLKDFRVATNTVSSSPKCEEKSLEDSIARLWRVTRLRRETRSDDSQSDCDVQINKSGSKYRFHLAICICIVDSLCHEPIWREFISDASQSNLLKASAELYIHAKFPEKIQSPWVREKTMDRTFRPEWNDVRIVRAMLALAAKALADDRTTHVIFLTESCIPIGRLSDVARVVMAHPSDSDTPEGSTILPNQSFLNAYNRNSPRCSRFDENHCFNLLSKHFPPESIYKALPGWCLLSRKHAQSILDLPTVLGLHKESPDESDLCTLFENVWAPEELYFPTCLALTGHLSGGNVTFKSLIFAFWDEKARNPSNRAHPLAYDHDFGESLVTELRQSGYLFMRKLQRPIGVHIWKHSIHWDEFESRISDDSSLHPSNKKRRQE